MGCFWGRKFDARLSVVSCEYLELLSQGGLGESSWKRKSRMVIRHARRSKPLSQGKDLPWEPLRTELVVEVAYEHAG